MNFMQKLNITRYIALMQGFFARVVKSRLAIDRSSVTKASLAILGTSALIGAPLLALDAHHSNGALTTHNLSMSTWHQPPTISESVVLDPTKSLQPVETSFISSGSANATPSNGEQAGTNENTNTVRVSVNGGTVETNGTGSLHKTINTNNASTQIDVNVQSTAHAGTTSNTTVNTQSVSSGTTTINSQTFRTGGNK